MGISVPSKSAQYTQYTASPKTFVDPYDWGSKVRCSFAKLTFTAAGYTTASAGDIGLIKLPAGKVRILGDLSRIICPQGTSTSDLDIGWAAYVGQDGVAVTANEDGIAASLDVGGGAINAALATGTVVEFSSQAGVDIVCSFDTANSPASGSLILLLVYMIGN
jgi:hypothetical protein